MPDRTYKRVPKKPRGRPRKARNTEVLVIPMSKPEMAAIDRAAARVGQTAEEWMLQLALRLAH